eukprot:TRINITY_DN10094_c1_g1_i2.p1 TRINITY_DN10094_c1_g1~~TRINITY_DN10094_c1_g1_i2.p1  ORF type:complete len:726 (-),score=96.12 TRINITY_DN10094_c1_g1_i2:116-2293(-)
MDRPHLRTAILDKLSRQVAGAARIAQKRIVKEFGPGNHDLIFGLSDQLVHALGKELQSLALEGLQGYTPSACSGEQGPSDSGNSAQELSVGSDSIDVQGPLDESEVNALVEDRLQCIKPFLQHEMLRATSPPDAIPPAPRVSKLTRDIAAHVRRRDAHVVVSSLNEGDLKKLQRGGRKTRTGADTRPHDCTFSRHFRDAQMAMENTQHGVTIDSDQLSFIAAYVAEAVQSKISGPTYCQACNSILQPTGTDLIGNLAPGTWSNLNVEVETFVPNFTMPSAPELTSSTFESPEIPMSYGDGKVKPNKPGHMVSPTDVVDAGIQAGSACDSCEQQTQSTFTCCFGSTIALIDRATQVDSSSARQACEKGTQWEGVIAVEASVACQTECAETACEKSASARAQLLNTAMPKQRWVDLASDPEDIEDQPGASIAHDRITVHETSVSEMSPGTDARDCHGTTAKHLRCLRSSTEEEKENEKESLACLHRCHFHEEEGTEDNVPAQHVFQHISHPLHHFQPTILQEETGTQAEVVTTIGNSSCEGLGSPVSPPVQSCTDEEKVDEKESLACLHRFRYHEEEGTEENDPAQHDYQHIGHPLHRSQPTQRHEETGTQAEVVTTNSNSSCEGPSSPASPPVASCKTGNRTKIGKGGRAKSSSGSIHRITTPADFDRYFERLMEQAVTKLRSRSPRTQSGYRKLRDELHQLEALAPQGSEVGSLVSAVIEKLNQT